MKIKDFLEIDRQTTLISLSYILDKSIPYLELNSDIELDDNISSRLNDIINKVKKNYPLQYAIGVWNFYGLDFKVDERALIPRSETELLVEKILESHIKEDSILDIGTGTGAIAITLAKNLKNSEVLGLDISKAALNLAEENKKLLNVSNVSFKQSDIFSNINEKFDIIVSNPPYINEVDYNSLDERLYYEPKNALFAENNGLYFYKKIIKESKKFLNEDASLFFEIGYDQKNDIIKLLKEENFKDIKAYQDYNGFDRIIESKA